MLALLVFAFGAAFGYVWLCLGLTGPNTPTTDEHS